MDFGNETVLKATGITKKYGAAKALDKVSIEIKRGMIYGLIGENGAGDSDIMMTDTINPLKSKFKASTKLLNKTI